MKFFRHENYIRVGDLSGDDHLWSSPRPQNINNTETSWCVVMLRKLLKDITYCICKDGKLNGSGDSESRGDAH